MAASSLIAVRVPGDIKARFAALAQRQGFTESALLRRMVAASLLSVNAVGAPPEPLGPVAASGRVSVRLRSDDLLLLRERATARAMPTGTYVSLLVRSHFRKLAPLPDVELAALKRAIAEISAIGRNLNQLARAANLGERPAGPSRSDLQALLRACTGLRDAMKGVINTNLASWEVGYEKTSA
jgi:hypothetical protein